jgi:hypothetical protein
VAIENTTRTAGPSRSMCRAISVPVKASGTGSLRSKARSPDPFTACASCPNTRVATSSSSGDRERVIGAAGSDGSPPNSALTVSAMASVSIDSTSASGEDADAAMVMAWFESVGRACAKRMSSTSATSSVAEMPSPSSRPCMIAGRERSASERAAAFTLSGSPVSPSRRSRISARVSPRPAGDTILALPSLRLAGHHAAFFSAAPAFMVLCSTASMEGRS